MRTIARTASAVAVIVVVSVLSSACYRHTIIAGVGAPNGRLIYDHWENFWIVGLIGQKTVNVAELCPSGNATIEAKQTFLNGLVSALTSGIYSPTTLRLRCQDGRVANIPLNGEDLQRIARDERLVGWVGADAPELLESVVDAQSSLARR